MTLPTSIALGGSDDIGFGAVIPFYLEVSKERIAIARTADGLFAFDDLCPHDGAPLSSGLLARRAIMCPCDGSLFDLGTGVVLDGPAEMPLRRFIVHEERGTVTLGRQLGD
ncbi:Rieske (2Fe-2S) protein [Microbacterium halophytorum]|uniref:Rieske (2Fe-2S) protein n=1 Tax=Microbacterium halophytorum TaxID=2067568 RepID=UPI000CFB5DB7|nr:Rieske 2Fe-2S domain-containing protein [Microbacterium halophytorum]